MLGGIAQVKDIGAALTFGGQTVVSKHGTSKVAFSGAGFDRLPLGPQRFDSVVIVLTATGSLTDTETFEAAISLEHADLDTDGTDPETGDYAAAGASYQPTAEKVYTSAGGGAYTVCWKYNVRVSELKRFIRATVTPDFSLANSSETALISVCIVGAGTQAVDQAADFTPTYNA